MANNADLQFKILAEYPTLEGLREALAKAREELQKIAIGSGNVSAAFKQQQVVVDGLSSTIKNYSNLQSVQQKEMEAVWASLDKLNKEGEKQQQIDVKKLTATNNNIVAMETLSKVQMSQIAAQTRANTTMQGSTMASANAGMALLNLNYVIRDSPYFFNNFAMGVLAIGNNLNPLIDSFNRLRTEALQKNITTMALLRNAMVGGAGISIAFSVVVTAIQAFVFQMSKAKTAGDEVKNTLDGIIDRMIKIDEISGQFGVSPEELDSKLASIDKAMKFYEEEIKRLTVPSLPGKGLAGVEYFTNLFESKKLTEEEEKQLDVYNKIIDKLKEARQTIQEEYAVSQILSDASFKRIEKEEKITKEKEKQNKLGKEALGQAQAMRVLMNVAGQAGFIGGDIRNLRGDGSQPQRDSPIAALFTGANGQHIKETMKEFNMALETGKIFANELGNALSEAFTKGELSLKKFTESLMAAIAQMLILRAVTAFLTGGTSLAASAVAGVPALPKSMNKNAIQVTGKITADKNNFIANIRNADNYFAKNEEFVLVGR
jgi:hypothetical protein